METKITRIDPIEARVDFSGNIIITYERKTEFEKKLQALIETYAL